MHRPAGRPWTGGGPHVLERARGPAGRVGTARSWTWPDDGGPAGVRPVADYTWRDSRVEQPSAPGPQPGGDRSARRRGKDLPSLTPRRWSGAAAKPAGSDDFGSDSFRRAARGLPRGVRVRGRADHVRPHPGLQDAEPPPWPTGSTSTGGPSITPRCGTSTSTAPGSSSACRAPAPACCPCCSGSTRWPGPSASGRPPTPSRPRPWMRRREDPRIAQTAKELDGLMKLNPPLKAMHPFGATLAQECVSPVHVRRPHPGPRDPGPRAHRTPAGWRRRTWPRPTPSTGWPCRPSSPGQPTERWILKTPNHLWHLDALLAAYPDARIIWTHRDPGPVVTTLASLANAGQRPLTRRADPRPTAEEWKRKCRSPSTRRWPSTSARRTGGAGTCTTTP